MTLVPNKPINRLAHVIKTYGASKSPVILTPTVRIALLTLGYDRDIQHFNEHFAPLQTMWVLASRSQRHSDQSRQEQRLLEWLGELLPAHHPREHMIPWVARELGRLHKAVQKNEATMRDYEGAVRSLEQQTTAIGMWAEANKIDLNKTTLAEALEAVEDFEYVPAGGVPQGHIVYPFPDGYTVQRLMERHELEAEGDIMQHCVGGEGYCEAAGAEETIIFSLRDKSGNPHATIEWKPDHTGSWEHVGLRPENEGRFVQIQGKQNKAPAEKYRPYIQEFVREKFFSDPIGLLMVAMPGQVISFADHVLADVDFGEEWAWENVPLQQADFSRAQFVRCTWGTGASWEAVNFDGAMFRSCTIEGTQFEKCRFEECKFDDTYMENVVAVDCRFLGAAFTGTTLVQCEFTRCDLRRTSWENNSQWKRLGLFAVDLRDAKFVEGTWGDVTFDDVDLDGATFDDWDVYSPITLKTVDLRRANREVVRGIWDTDPYRLVDVHWPDWVEEEDETEAAN